MNIAEPATLDHAGIASRIPHRGRMCLLDRLERWSAETIHCSASGHHAADHPLRSASGLLGACAIEYAAQAMALHGALVAAPGSTISAGYLASVRGVNIRVARLDTVAGTLQIHASRLAGDETRVSYQFHVADEAGACLVDGRATVVLNTPLMTATAP